MTTRNWGSISVLDDALSAGLTEAEYSHIKEVLGREITVLETGICAALYSEHCSYKSSILHLKTLPTQGKHVLQGPGENAGIVDIGDGQALAFKIESHNHPSFIEPYQGAATGVGGILRDIFTMGARPIALMNALRFGDLSHPKTGYLLKHAVAGIGGYGNCVGVPTVGGELYFHESYNGNCLVNAFALGIVDHDKIFRGSAAGVGNSVIYVGSKTGRDGIHGATMASESFDADSEEKRPTVQVGDPFQEKLLLEACLEAMRHEGIVGIQDMGAAGLTSSTYEMASRAGTGLRIHLDQVPQRETNMTPYDLMLSESQERMLLVVRSGFEDAVCRIFTHWELDAVRIGEVIEGGDVELYWHGEMVSSLPAALLTNSVPPVRWPERAPAEFEAHHSFDVLSIPPAEDLSAVWLDMLASPNVCSRHQIFSQYDSTVRTNTVIHPGGDAAVVRVKGDDPKAPEKGIAMTLDCNSRYCSLDPRQGTALSVAEAVRNITCVGAEPIGISNCLNFPSPERPEGMWQLAEAIRGLGEAARSFDVPVISGNVSLYNETLGKGIWPTPQIALVGLTPDASRCIGVHFKAPGDTVLVLGLPEATGLGGSEYLAQYAKVEKGSLPILNYDLEITTSAVIRDLIRAQLLVSCHDISAGGLAVALAESCFNPVQPLGVTVDEEIRSERPDVQLFSESGARYLLSCSPENEQEVRERITSNGLKIALSGKVGGACIEVKNLAKVPLDGAYQRWRSGLDRLFA